MSPSRTLMNLEQELISKHSAEVDRIKFQSKNSTSRNGYDYKQKSNKKRQHHTLEIESPSSLLKK